MGFISDAVGGLMGSGADAAKDAAGRIIERSQANKKILRKAGKWGIEQYEDFAEEGRKGLEGLGDLITDPEAQKKFITENPFFEAMAQRSQENILGSAGARGKIFSGGTAEGLQNSMLLLGNSLLGTQIGRQTGLAQMGQQAVGNQVGVKQWEVGGITGANTQIGQAGAAGVMGARAAEVGALNQVISLATMGMGGMGGGGGGNVDLSGTGAGQINWN